MKRWTPFAALVTIIMAVTWLCAETDYQVGQGVQRVITRRLQVQGNNARAIIKGATEITGNVVQTGDLDITGDVDVTGAFAATTIQGSLAGTDISGTLCASMPVSATYSTATNGAITIQAKDPAGANLRRATAFEFWFTTAAVVTTPATNEIQSFSVQNGDMRMYREIGSAVPTYIAQTDNTGKFLVNTVVYTNGASSLTNYFHLLGPNGYYTNFQCKYNP